MNSRQEPVVPDADASEQARSDASSRCPRTGAAAARGRGGSLRTGGGAVPGTAAVSRAGGGGGPLPSAVSCRGIAGCGPARFRIRLAGPGSDDPTTGRASGIDCAVSRSHPGGAPVVRLVPGASPWWFLPRAIRVRSVPGRHDIAAPPAPPRLAHRPGTEPLPIHGTPAEDAAARLRTGFPYDATGRVPGPLMPCAAADALCCRVVRAAAGSSGAVTGRASSPGAAAGTEAAHHSDGPRTSE